MWQHQHENWHNLSRALISEFSLLVRVSIDRVFNLRFCHWKGLVWLIQNNSTEVNWTLVTSYFLYSFFIFLFCILTYCLPIFCAIVKARDLSDHIWEFIGHNEALHFWVHLDATIQYFNFEPGIVHISVSCCNSCKVNPIWWNYQVWHSLFSHHLNIYIELSLLVCWS
jgi:hypothetical protein